MLTVMTKFSGDIFSNITISAPQLGLKEAWEAAEMAGVADDIRNMPMGMHTILSEGSGGISGGQRQRLMIARFQVRYLLLRLRVQLLQNRKCFCLTRQPLHLITLHRNMFLIL